MTGARSWCSLPPSTRGCSRAWPSRRRRRRSPASSGSIPARRAITIAALTDRGWCIERDGRVGLTPAARAAIGPDPADPVLAEVLLAAREIAAYQQLETTLRTGAPSHDVSAGDTATRRRFLEAMRAIAARRAAATVGALPAPAGGGRLLDVGGGPGTYARAFREHGWQVTVIDLPESLELGGDDLRGGGSTSWPGTSPRACRPGRGTACTSATSSTCSARRSPADLVRRAGAALVPGRALGDPGGRAAAWPPRRRCSG